MGYSKGQQPANFQEISFTYDNYVLSRITKMGDAEAAEDKYQQWCFFKQAMRACTNYLDMDIRKRIQEDWITLKEQTAKLKAAGHATPTKDKLILDLQADFADAHEYYIHMALGKMGMVKVSDEGSIDVKAMGLENVAHVIRNTGKSLDDAVDRHLNESTDDYEKGAEAEAEVEAE